MTSRLRLNSLKWSVSNFCSICAMSSSLADNVSSDFWKMLPGRTPQLYQSCTKLKASEGSDSFGHGAISKAMSKALGLRGKRH